MDAYFYAQRGSGIRLMLGRVLRILHWDPKWWADCDAVNAFLDQRVDEALGRLQQRREDTNANAEEPPTPPGEPTRATTLPPLCLVDEIAKQTQDRFTLRSQIHNLFTPAHDSAAITLSNALFHLARHPHAWARLRAEILPTYDQPVTYALLKRYSYLRNVVRETHRLTPISTLTARECLRDVVFPTGGGAGGRSPLLVRAGDIVEMHFRCTLRDRDYWGDDAEDFRPERWEDDGSGDGGGLRPTWEYTPFGGGPRVCPGFRLAFVEVAHTLVSLLREFGRLESRDDRPWTEETRSTFQNLHGARVALFLA